MTVTGELANVEATPALFPPPGVDVVVFDVVGTLIEPSPSVAVAYQRAAARHGVECDVAEVQGRFRAAWKRQEEIDAAASRPFATSRAREADRWRGIVDEVFAGQPASAAIFADLWAHFGRVDAWRPIERGRDLVLRALDARATVVLASNFDERLFAIAGRMEPLCWADEVFPSAEIGWRKPAAEFFRWIERRIGSAPERMLLVGDDPLLDIAAARRSGWRALSITGDPG